MSLRTASRKLGAVAFGHSFVVLFVLASILSSVLNQVVASTVEDNEFAEFEEFSEEEYEPVKKAEPGAHPSRRADDEKAAKSPESAGGTHAPQASIPQPDEEAETVEEEVEDEFSHLEDDEEFITADTQRPIKGASPATGAKDQLKITNIPVHLLTNWANFQVEMLMVAGLVAYLLNYLWGKSKNSLIANTWFELHRDMLEENFQLVGDDGAAQEPQGGSLIKESDASFRVWCTGRTGCQSMAVHLKLQKRQDLVHTISGLFRPVHDQVIVQVSMNADDMDTYVFAVGTRKTVAKLGKEMIDLSDYCAEKKGVEATFGLPSSFMVLSEIGEATAAIFDPKMQASVRKFEDVIEHIHFSDQYAGRKPPEGEPVRQPETSKMLLFAFNIPTKPPMSVEQRLDAMKPLMKMVFHCIDKVKRFKLSKEGKAKADKDRTRVQERYLKATHAARVEAAQTRREDKIRERKEKMMAEEDPEKQKRLEKQELKREAKMKMPKMKQLKIKA